MDSWHQIRNNNLSVQNIKNVFKCFCGKHPLPDFPPYESKHAPEKERNNVLVSGVARSGSTVAWQVVNFLSNERVLKSHGFSDSCPTMFRFDHVIVTVRHPFDAFYSKSRREKRPNTEKDIEMFIQMWNDVGAFLLLNNLQGSTGYRPDMKITFLKYEDFWNKDRDRILHLSGIIDRKINNKELDEILSKTSLDQNIELSKVGQSTVEENKGRNTITPRIHASHVGERRGKPGQGVQLDKETKDKILKNLEWVFEEFGYEKNGEI